MRSDFSLNKSSIMVEIDLLTFSHFPLYYGRKNTGGYSEGLGAFRFFFKHIFWFDKTEERIELTTSRPRTGLATTCIIGYG